MAFKNILFYNFLISNVMFNVCMDSMSEKKLVNMEQISHSGNNMNNSLNINRNGSSWKTTPKEDDGLETTTTANNMESFETVSHEKTTAKYDNVSCACAIFLGSQFLKGSSVPPKGEPVISSVIGRSFACNSTGQRLCQTKCLEKIVQHLPDSANILCATLDRDIRKEKAYLFVRNCSSKWRNTNLTSGREYCCKSGLPYNCPRK